MVLTRKAFKNLKDYDLYVKIIADVNGCIEYQICNISDDITVCEGIFEIDDVNSILEDWW